MNMKGRYNTGYTHLVVGGFMFVVLLAACECSPMSQEEHFLIDNQALARSDWNNKKHLLRKEKSFILNNSHHKRAKRATKEIVEKDNIENFGVHRRRNPNSYEKKLTKHPVNNPNQLEDNLEELYENEDDNPNLTNSEDILQALGETEIEKLLSHESKENKNAEDTLTDIETEDPDNNDELSEEYPVDYNYENKETTTRNHKKLTKTTFTTSRITSYGLSHVSKPDPHSMSTLKPSGPTSTSRKISLRNVSGSPEAVEIKQSLNSSQVYVQRGWNTVLSCLSEEESYVNQIDPKFTWTGPNGNTETLSNPRFGKLETGDLKIDDAQSKDAGDYVCMVSGKTESGGNSNITSNHTLSVFTPPRYEYRISLRYDIKRCNRETENKKIRQIKMTLCSEDKECVFKVDHSCHAIRDKTTSNIEHEVWVRIIQTLPEDFKFPKCSPDCSMKAATNALDKDYDNITQLVQMESLTENSLQYKEDSLTMSLQSHCDGGYQKLDAAACIACLPGSYSSKDNVSCTPCPLGQYQEDYGIKQCVHCPDKKVTKDTGANSRTMCVASEFNVDYHTKQGIIDISLIAACILAFFLFLIVFICLLRRLRHKKQKMDSDAHTDREHRHELDQLMEHPPDRMVPMFPFTPVLPSKVGPQREMNDDFRKQLAQRRNTLKSIGTFRQKASPKSSESRSLDATSSTNQTRSRDSVTSASPKTSRFQRPLRLTKNRRNRNRVSKHGDISYGNSEVTTALSSGKSSGSPRQSVVQSVQNSAVSVRPVPSVRGSLQTQGSSGHSTVKHTTPVASVMSSLINQRSSVQNDVTLVPSVQKPVQMENDYADEYYSEDGSFDGEEFLQPTGYNNQYSTSQQDTYQQNSATINDDTNYQNAYADNDVMQHSHFTDVDSHSPLMSYTSNTPLVAAAPVAPVAPAIPAASLSLLQHMSGMIDPARAVSPPMVPGQIAPPATAPPVPEGPPPVVLPPALGKPPPPPKPPSLMTSEPGSPQRTSSGAGHQALFGSINARRRASSSEQFL